MNLSILGTQATKESDCEQLVRVPISTDNSAG